MLEVELLALGWLERLHDAHGRETLRLTAPGIEVLHLGLQKNRAARDRHEDLVARMATELQRAGRIVWRGLSLRAPWMHDGCAARPDDRFGPCAGRRHGHTTQLAPADIQALEAYLGTL